MVRRLLLVVFLLAVWTEAKPPKSLNRLRSKGSYSAANLNIASLANNGLLLANLDYDNGTMTSSDERLGKRDSGEAANEGDDIDDLLAGDLLQDEDDVTTTSEPTIDDVTEM
ncbi:unnamed protein product [Caenorhabditis auriculariae]|uniref:Uncharacterized protein n=1 Tax=Caenorhabditis auriculariae TaxID=2777116 RepID=A0A8S1GUY4_9PELO|nr:unnamed protein product [Caenorhabditis auriculariae]